MAQSVRERDELLKERTRVQLARSERLASVGRLAAGVAHEINNPLAIIYEEAGLMKDALDPQFAHGFDQKEFLESLDAIMEATLRGRSITSKLMAFARKHDAEPEATDLNQVLERVLSIKDHELRVSNIEVQQELAEGLPKVMVNPNQMEQVLLNLINNAMDAISDSGRISLRMRLDGGRVAIEVEDTGCGMSGDQMAKIFFPFFTTKAVGKGTGLGLSISYGIIKALGGSIEVASEVGEGSTFTITLPVVKSEANRLTGHFSHRGDDGKPFERIAG
jgi:two-component system NtrC family sensor kinase